jgi:hypothetical protein
MDDGKENQREYCFDSFLITAFCAAAYGGMFLAFLHLQTPIHSIIFV